MAERPKTVRELIRDLALSDPEFAFDALDAGAVTPFKLVTGREPNEPFTSRLANKET